ncbi:MAG TPA: FtsQ-type POTRA domain-containing protein [Candidatus Limnocylindrales bacterium]|nr:FtsQ-type POTRA domain-containing protein [Candidatus Limnocylindrales bacterium]
MALAAFGGLLVLAAFPLYPIGTVEVAGARHVARERAGERAALRGRPAFWADSARARAGLLELPAVRDARVELALPDRARIVLVEREAVVRWVVGNLEWFVDAEGVLFASADGSAAPALWVDDEREPERAAGERLDPALVDAAVRLAKLAPGELRADALDPRVRIVAGLDGLIFESGAGWEVRFGGPERFEEKLALARSFLREEPERRLEYLDVRSADQLVFR